MKKQHESYAGVGQQAGDWEGEQIKMMINEGEKTRLALLRIPLVSTCDGDNNPAESPDNNVFHFFSSV